MRVLNKEYSCDASNQKDSDSFDLFLCNFQEDIRRIIGKFRKNYHALSPEELASECNVHLLKYKNKILDSFLDSEFNESDFKKISYHYVKNLVSWSHYGEVNEKYNAKRLDQIHETEDGSKTTFELSLDTQGKEDSFFDVFDSESSIKNFYHILINYSYLLSETESKILSFLKSGMSQDEIAEVLGVTHQAISHGFVSLKEKLQAYFDFDEIFENSSDSESNGKKAIDNFFSRKKITISERQKLKIKNFVLNNPNQYTFNEVNKKLFKNKFTSYQICGALRKLKLSHLCLREKTKNLCDNSFRSEILKLYKRNFSTKEISKKLNLEENVVSATRRSLFMLGLLDKAKAYSPILPDEVTDKIIEFYKDLENLAKKSVVFKKHLNPDPHIITLKINKFFKNSNYHKFQISRKIGNLRFKGILPKKPLIRESDKRSDEILNLFKLGLSSEEVSEKTGINKKEISFKKQIFSRKNMIPKQETFIFNKENRDKISKLFLSGKNSKEISLLTNFSEKSIKGFRGYLVYKKILKPLN